MKVKKEIPEVVTVRTWKEYIEESVLIIFSVVLALFLTELFQKIHEDGRLHQVVHELRQKLISNRKAEEIQLRYHLQVLKNIDAALANPAIGQQVGKTMSQSRPFCTTMIAPSLRYSGPRAENEAAIIPTHSAPHRR
jgi:hypothetical protein